MFIYHAYAVTDIVISPSWPTGPSSLAVGHPRTERASLMSDGHRPRVVGERTNNAGTFPIWLWRCRIRSRCRWSSKTGAQIGENGQLAARSITGFRQAGKWR